MFKKYYKRYYKASKESIERKGTDGTPSTCPEERLGRLRLGGRARPGNVDEKRSVK